MVNPFPEKKYAVIYADPPWGYRNKGTRAADRHYSTMSIEDITIRYWVGYLDALRAVERDAK